MLASALSFTLLDLIIKLMGPAYRVWDISFYRWGGGFVLLVIIFGWRGNLFKTHNIKLMSIRSITGCITFLSLTTAIRNIPLSTAMVLFFSFPAFSALFAALLFKERISKGELLCIAGTLIGVFVLLDFKLGGEWFGYLLGLNSGVFAGLTVCLIKILRQKDGPVVIYLYFCMLGAAITITPFCAHPTLPASAIEWTMVSGIAFSAIIGQLFMNQGFKYCKSWEGGQLMTSELVFTAILGIWLLGEQLTWRFGLGGVLILICAILLNLFKARTISHPEVTIPEHQAATR